MPPRRLPTRPVKPVEVFLIPNLMQPPLLAHDHPIGGDRCDTRGARSDGSRPQERVDAACTVTPSTARPIHIDEIMRRALYGAAGEVQTEANEIGIEHVSEADLRRATRRALQMQLGPVVHPEGARGFKLPSWPGRLWGPDIAIRHLDGSGHRSYAELKWCREDTLFEVLWDMCKLALTLREFEVAESAYLVVGAPRARWDLPAACADLVADGRWTTVELFERYRQQWQWLLDGNKSARPAQLPAEIETRRLDGVPVHVATGDDWELRAVSVQPSGEGWLRFEGDWPAVS